ncbi:hypothetical protein CC86DRAFT_150012 [Ophiobolus disseminans]|uniref:Uncharacterized protein n=1 Tax=Ophiobolus disseminans TaxID=1469910 RepID=A0A6A6ZE74_9PLEO|nr:hypothetical protein CC86DRAFT_150012 [Ophiobolus disseminans]
MDHSNTWSINSDDDSCQSVSGKDMDNGSKSEQRRNKAANALGAFPFLPSLKGSISTPAKVNTEDGSAVTDVEGAESIATASQQNHGRKRTNSLRKAAMAKFGLSRKERIPTSTPTIIPAPMSTDSPTSSHNDTLKPGPEQQLQHRNTPYSQPSSSRRPAPYNSTAEEEPMSFQHLPDSSSSSSVEQSRNDKPVSLLQRRSHRSTPRPLLSDSPTPDDFDIEDDWDYSETEWWGWVILIATWIVFVVVMGSCLGVWSWAWDVGETPYAPPDLEDDDTLPIAGYYPALMVCTAVMSWVWVVVAWGGIKAFRHAKVG